ncbi:hypothetical protein AGMMS49579_06130 [Spirochaetia bacterium]|nr:hypothetical protein AGMMS49579_06130 [Spirochaetia bacterium]
MVITEVMVHEAYETARRIYGGALSHQDGVTLLQRIGMNEKSAVGYIHVYRCMMNGECYTWTINEYATDYYLGSIRRDNGINGLENALEAVRQHLDYQTDHNILNGIREIYHKYLKLVKN